MTYARHEIQAAYDYMVDVIAARADGAAYMPIFERLEAELKAMDDRESAVERVRRIKLEREALRAA